MTNEKSFAEIQAMTSVERRHYYAQREKTTNSQPGKKIRRPTRRIEKRKKRRITNKKIREKVYDRPFDNPQLQPAIVVAVRARRRKLLRKVGYVAPIPAQ